MILRTENYLWYLPRERFRSCCCWKGLTRSLRWTFRACYQMTLAQDWWWIAKLGGWKHFFCSSLPGEMIQVYQGFSKCLKPPTRKESGNFPSIISGTKSTLWWNHIVHFTCKCYFWKYVYIYYMYEFLFLVGTRKECHLFLFADCIGFLFPQIVFLF